MTREQFEAALDAGHLQTRIQDREGDKWYTCRRYGKTKTWKTRPDEFVIPIKFRFKDYMRVESNHFYSNVVDKWFRVQTTEA